MLKIIFYFCLLIFTKIQRNSRSMLVDDKFKYLYFYIYNRLALFKISLKNDIKYSIKFIRNFFLRKTKIKFIR